MIKNTFPYMLYCKEISGQPREEYIYTGYQNIEKALNPNDESLIAVYKLDHIIKVKQTTEVKTLESLDVK